VSYFDALLLGIVQGLTEFLPVSSSGHLVLVGHLLGVQHNSDLTFEVFVHFGTLMSVAVMYWHDLVAIVRSFAKASLHPLHVAEQYRQDEMYRLGVQILVASVPAGVIGVLFEEDIAAAFTDPKLVATMLVVTGLILFLTRLARPSPDRQQSLAVALAVGCAQAFAIIPGISRSGTTISAGMYCRILPERAARFSFLMSLPVICGATLLKTEELISTGTTLDSLGILFIGTAAAFVSGYVAIRVLLQVIARGKFRLFAVYCLVVGIFGIILI